VPRRRAESRIQGSAFQMRLRELEAEGESLIPSAPRRLHIPRRITSLFGSVIGSPRGLSSFAASFALILILGVGTQVRLQAEDSIPWEKNGCWIDYRATMAKIVIQSLDTAKACLEHKCPPSPFVHHLVVASKFLDRETKALENLERKKFAYVYQEKSLVAMTRSLIILLRVEFLLSGVGNGRHSDLKVAPLLDQELGVLETVLDALIPTLRRSWWPADCWVIVPIVKDCVDRVSKAKRLVGWSASGKAEDPRSLPHRRVITEIILDAHSLLAEAAEVYRDWDDLFDIKGYEPNRPPDESVGAIFAVYYGYQLGPNYNFGELDYLHQRDPETIQEGHLQRAYVNKASKLFCALKGTSPVPPHLRTLRLGRRPAPWWMNRVSREVSPGIMEVALPGPVAKSFDLRGASSSVVETSSSPQTVPALSPKKVSSQDVGAGTDPIEEALETRLVGDKIFEKLPVYGDLASCTDDIEKDVIPHYERALHILREGKMSQPRRHVAHALASRTEVDLTIFRRLVMLGRTGNVTNPQIKALLSWREQAMWDQIHEIGLGLW